MIGMNRIHLIGLIIAFAVHSQVNPTNPQPEGKVKTRSAPHIPGDPQHVVKAFHKIYQGLVGFRDIHHRLPHYSELTDFSHQIAPGVTLTREDFLNPDVGLPEDPLWKPKRMDRHYAIKYELRRSDGSLKSQFPRVGVKDLWVSTEGHYVRDLVVTSAKGSQVKFYGFVVGLFSDGSVEIVPIGKMIGVQDKRKMIHAAFPDETGLPMNRMTLEKLSNKIILENRLKIDHRKPL